jgi:hypothetical protein
MKHNEDRMKVIDENHPGLKLAGKALIIEAILIFVLIVLAYLTRYASGG